MATRATLAFDKFLGVRLANGVVDYSNGIISALKCDNVELYRYGQGTNTGIRTQRGQQVIGELEGFNILGQWSSIQDGVEHWFIYAEDDTKGVLFTYNGVDFDIRIDNLQKTGNANAITASQGYYEYLIFTNGEDFYTYSFARNPQAEQINAVDDQGRAIKGLSLALNKGRLYIETGNRCHYSKQFDFYTWDANDFDDDGIPISTNSGYEEFTNQVTAIAAYIEGIIVFTERDSTLLQGNPMILSQYQRMDASIGGTVSYGSFVIHDQYLFFYDKLQRNIYHFLQNDVGQRRTGEPIAFEIQPYLMYIDENRLNEIKMYSVYADGKNEIWLLLPTVNNSQKIMIFDYILKEWIVRVEDKISCINVARNAIYSAGGKNLIRENLGNLRKIASYELNIINMGSNTNLKIPKLIPTVTLDENYNNEFWFEIGIDGKSKVKQKFIKQRIDYAMWGDDEPDDEPPNNKIWDVAILGENREGQRTIKLPPIAAFRWLNLRFFTQNPNDEFALKNFELKRIRIKEKTL